MIRSRLTLFLGASVSLLLLVPCLAYQGKGQGGAPSSQNSSPQNNSGGPSSNPGQSTGSGGGFSMEAEVLAYQSLQSDSEAIACDIAAYLLRNYLPASPNPMVPASTSTDPELPASVPKSLPKIASPCLFVIKPPAMKPESSPTGVVLLLSSDTGLANLQQWRASMAIMMGLQLTAKAYCQENKEGEEKAFVPGDVITTADQAVTLVKDIVGLFATNQSISGVQGTIQDQALANGVARQLKAFGVPVLVPATYSPYAMGGLDATDSPFLSNYDKLIRLRMCLQAQRQSASNAMDKSAIASLTAQLKSLSDQ